MTNAETIIIISYFQIQDCWPYITLWIVQSNKKIAVSKISARELVYSPIEEERGQFCGKRRTLIFNVG